MVIVVKPGQSIQAAVNAAVAGDTILVKQGVYNESILIQTGKERIRLLGDGAGETILSGSGLGPVNGITVDASDFVTIAGFTIHSFQGAGVLLRTGDNIVRDNEVQGNVDSGVIIEPEAARNLVKANKVLFNGAHGITTAGPHTYVVANTVNENAGAGINVAAGSTYTLLLENVLARNTGLGASVHASSTWLIGNQATENAMGGLAVRDAEHVLVYGNTCTGNADCGLEADALGLIVVKNNLSSNGKAGFEAASSGAQAQLGLQLSLLYGNEMSHNHQSGFTADQAMVGSMVFKNDVFENGTDGVHVGGSRNRVLFNNVTQNRGPGLCIEPLAEGNVIDANHIERNQQGGLMIHDGSAANSVRGNTLGRNRPFDIQAKAPAETENTFDLNTFEQNSPAGIGG